MRKGYGQFCPVAKAAEVFCERWTALLFRELGAGSTRFTQLQRGLPLMSPSMLSRRLKELEHEGLIERRCRDARTPTYHLTPAGQEFLPIVEALGVWGQRWSRRELAADEIDYGLLLWDMERRVRPCAFGPHRSAVQLEFTDLPAARAHWWFVGEGEQAELCLDDPGFEIDLYLAASVPDLTYVWRGDLPLARAIAEGRLEAHGPTPRIKALGAWLNLSPLAAVPSARA